MLPGTRLCDVRVRFVYSLINVYSSMHIFSVWCTHSMYFIAQTMAMFRSKSVAKASPKHTQRRTRTNCHARHIHHYSVHCIDLSLPRQTKNNSHIGTHEVENVRHACQQCIIQKTDLGKIAAAEKRSSDDDDDNDVDNSQPELSVARYIPRALYSIQACAIAKYILYI